MTSENQKDSKIFELLRDQSSWILTINPNLDHTEINQKQYPSICTFSTWIQFIQ